MPEDYELENDAINSSAGEYSGEDYSESDEECAE